MQFKNNLTLKNTELLSFSDTQCIHKNWYDELLVSCILKSL